MKSITFPFNPSTAARNPSPPLPPAAPWHGRARAEPAANRPTGWPARPGAALAAAANLLLQPLLSLLFARAGMLSADGRCKTFDALANGYTRSEAVGSLVLRCGDDGLASLLGHAVRQDGRSASLTAPNGAAQRALMAAAMVDANPRPCLSSFMKAWALASKCSTLVGSYTMPPSANLLPALAASHAPNHRFLLSLSGLRLTKRKSLRSFLVVVTGSVPRSPHGMRLVSGSLPLTMAGSTCGAAKRSSNGFH